MKDLLVSAFTPTLTSGRAVRTYGVARALAAGGGGVAMLYVRFGADMPDQAFRGIPGIEFHHVVPSRGPRRFAAYVGARRRGVPAGFARGVSSELADAAERLGERYGGRLIADGPVEAAALARLARTRPVIYNAHNLESAFRHDLDAADLGSPETLRAFERRTLALAAESWMVSELDAQAARALCPQARVRVVPNVVDVARITLAVPMPGARRALFIGNLAYEPNRVALRFLVDQVMPRVWATLPDARLRVVGGRLSQPPTDDRRVELLGFVEDVATAYHEVSCAVVPLLQGGGTPLKFIEALAYGLPVVATPRAAAGLAVCDGVHCVLAEGAEQFAQAILSILREGAPELGERGRALVAERYSIEALVPLVRP